VRADRWLGIRLVFLACAAVFVGMASLENAWRRRSPRYARVFAFRRLASSLEALAPTRTTPSADAPATYRAPPRVPFVDVARLPLETPLPDGAILRRFAGRAEWLVEGVGGSRRREHRAVWLGLRLVDDEVRVEARAVTSILVVLLPFLVPTALALFTTASLPIVVLSVFFVVGLAAIIRLPSQTDHERLASAALVEIEHALAETDESPHVDDEVEA
jgi:hypothetical protein